MLAAFLMAGYLQAQNTFPSTGSVGIGTTTPNGSALLDMVSTSKGLLIPRMTKSQRDGISTPATGLMIYQTNNSPGFYYYSGSGWVAIAPKGANKNLSNLNETAINLSLIPGASGTIDLGSSSLAWRNGYFTGNIGNGIASPEFKMDIRQDITFSGDVNPGGAQLSVGAATGNKRMVFGYDNAGNSGNGFGYIISANYLQTYTPLALQPNGGNVGIGVTNPFEPLTVNSNALITGAADSRFFINKANPINGASVIFNQGGPGLANSWGEIGITADNKLHFKANPVAGAFTDRMVIDNINGNVGIGTISPSANLHINAGIHPALLKIEGYEAATTWINNNVDGTGGDTAAYMLSANHGNFYINYSPDNFGVASSNVGYFSDPAGTYSFVLNGSANAVGGVWVSSDATLKNNIKPLGSVMDKIKLLNPVTYTYKHDGEAAKMNLPKTPQIGLIAQELEKVFPEFVKTDRKKNADGSYSKDVNGLKSVNYAGIVPVLIEGLQEQQKQLDAKDAAINQLQKDMQELKAQMNQLIQAQNLQSGSSKSVTLNNNDAASLNQNVPNPFSNSTVINFSLPKQYKNAQITITDINGKTIQQANVNNTSYLKITAGTLPAGTYKYSLVVDGKSISTKTMVLTK